MRAKENENEMSCENSGIIKAFYDLSFSDF